jgi:hypothetical protein
MSATISPAAPPSRPAAQQPPDHVPLLWVGFVLASLLALDLLSLTVWSIAVSLAAAALWLVSSGWWRSPSISRPGALDRRDLAVIAALYLAVVGLWRLAFTVFSADRWVGLFLCFGGGMVLGVAVPVLYTVWLRRRPLASLGIGTHQLRATVALGVLFGGCRPSSCSGATSCPRRWTGCRCWSGPWPWGCSRRSSSAASSRAGWRPASALARRWPAPPPCMRCTTSATAWAWLTWGSCSPWAWSTPSPTGSPATSWCCGRC